MGSVYDCVLASKERTDYLKKKSLIENMQAWIRAKNQIIGFDSEVNF